MLIDLSHHLNSQTVSFPDDPKLSLAKISDFENNGFTNFQITSGMHIGTHIDGKAHLTNSTDEIGNADINLFCGDTILLNFKNQELIDINEKLLEMNIFEKIILIYTDFDRNWGKQEYFLNHPILSSKFVNHLIKNKIKMVGIDFPSPDKAPYNIHKQLLENGIFILENLTNLDKLVDKKNIQLMAFPLKIAADSSPVRAIAQCN